MTNYICTTIPLICRPLLISADSVVPMVLNGSTTSGPTTPNRLAGLNLTALAIFRRLVKGTRLLWSVMLCTFLVAGRKRVQILVIWLHSGLHLDDGIHSRTWDLRLPHDQATA